MERSLFQELEKRHGHQGFRSTFLLSDFCQKTKLQDILNDPERVWNSLETTRGLGSISKARLRLLLSQRFAEHFPEAWRKAKRAVAQGIIPESPEAKKLARFITVWDPPRDSFEITGRYFTKCEATLLEGLNSGEPFLLANSTLPKMLKTPEVFYAEKGHEMALSAHQRNVRKILKKGKRVPDGSTATIEETALDNLISSCGVYKNLDEAQQSAQFRLISDLLVSFPNLDVMVVNYSRIDLSPGLLCGEAPYLHRCCGGYIEVHAPELIEIFRERMETARKTGEPLKKWLDRHSDHPVIQRARRAL